MTVFLHRTYTSVYTSEGHTHAAGDTVTVTGDDALDLSGSAEEPARLASGTWRVSCTHACEQDILTHTAPYSGTSEKGIPLTKDEEVQAQAEEKRGNVEVANLARAMHSLVRAGDQT
jgi:hypothetical protein